MWDLEQDCTNQITFKNTKGQEITLTRDYENLTDEDLELAAWVLEALNKAEKNV